MKKKTLKKNHYSETYTSTIQCEVKEKEGRDRKVQRQLTYKVLEGVDPSISSSMQEFVRESYSVGLYTPFRLFISTEEYVKMVRIEVDDRLGSMRFLWCSGLGRHL